MNKLYFISMLYRIATDSSIAKNFAKAFADKCISLRDGISLWDVQDRTRGYEPGYFSFGLKPEEFPENGIPGGLFVKGYYGLTENGKYVGTRSSQPEEGSKEYDEWLASGGSTELSEATEMVELEIGYIHKINESGKFQKSRNAGKFFITLDSKENVTIDKDQDFSELADAMEDIINDVIENKKELGVELVYHGKGGKKQRDKEVSWKKQQKDQSDVDTIRSDVYGSLDSFIMESEDNEFGNLDISYLLRYLPKSEGHTKQSIIDYLKDYGMKYVPGRNSVASSPRFISNQIRRIAKEINKSRLPNRKLVAFDIQRIINSLN